MHRVRSAHSLSQSASRHRNRQKPDSEEHRSVCAGTASNGPASVGFWKSTRPQATDEVVTIMAHIHVLHRPGPEPIASTRPPSTDDPCPPCAVRRVRPAPSCKKAGINAAGLGLASAREDLAAGGSQGSCGADLDE